MNRWYWRMRLWLHDLRHPGARHSKSWADAVRDSNAYIDHDMRRWTHETAHETAHDDPEKHA